MLQWLAVLALRWASWSPADESALEHLGRVVDIAAAIQAETPTPALAVGVLVIWRAESDGFSRAVHIGDKTGDHGRALCLGQLHATGWVLPAEHALLGGVSLEATRRCAAATARVLANMHHWCGSWPGAFSAYATGKGCQVTRLGAERAALQQTTLADWRRERRRLNTLARATSDTP